MRRILLAALAIVWTVLMACTPPQQSSTSKSRTQASDQDLFVQLSRVFCDESSDKGTPYVANTLEPCVLPADPVNAVEDMVINLDSVDCTTFVEYMAAAMLAGYYGKRFRLCDTATVSVATMLPANIISLNG